MFANHLKHFQLSYLFLFPLHILFVGTCHVQTVETVCTVPTFETVETVGTVMYKHIEERLVIAKDANVQTENMYDTFNSWYMTYICTNTVGSYMFMYQLLTVCTCHVPTNRVHRA